MPKGTHGVAGAPRGWQIAFVNDRNGSSDLYVASSAGTNERVIASGSGTRSSPSVSPDGTMVAFTWSANATAATEVRVVGIDGTGQRTVPTPAGSSMLPAWSPDGRRLAFVHKGGDDKLATIWTAGINGSTPIRLTEPSAASFDPAWSPDGRRLAFARVVPGQGHGTVASVHLWIMDADGRGQRQLAPGQLTSPAWSPDGHQIAARALDSGRGAIAVVDAATGATRAVTSADGWDGSPAWSGDGAAIVFDRDPDGHEAPMCWAGVTTEVRGVECVPTSNGPQPSNLWVVDEGGGAARRLDVPGSSTDPATGPS